METIQIEIKSNAPQVEKETTSLRQQIKELRKEMESCAVGTDEYTAALQKLANVTHDYKDQQEEIRNSAGDLGTVFDNLQSVSSNVAAGFSAVNAVTTLFGANSENLQKVMVRLQQGMALVQGLKGMEGMGKNMKHLITSVKALITSTKTQATANKALAASEGTVTTATKATSTAMKGLKKAILATGIGIFIVLVGELAAHLEDLVKWFKSNKKEAVDYGEVLDNLTEKHQKQNKELELKLAKMKLEGKSYEELYFAQLEHLTAQKLEIQNTLLQIETEQELINLRKKKNGELRKKDQEQYENNKVAIEKYRDALLDLDLSITNLKNNYNDYVNNQTKSSSKLDNSEEKAIQAAKKRADEYSKMLKKADADWKKYFDDLIKEMKKAQETIKQIGGIFNIEGETDEEIFRVIYGINPDSLKGRLEGIAQSILSYDLETLTNAKNSKVSELQTQIEELRADAQIGVDKLKTLKNKLDEVEEQLKRTRDISQKEALKAQKAEILGEFQSIEEEVKATVKQIETAEVNIEKIKQAYAKAGNDLVQNQSALSNKLSAIESKITDDTYDNFVQINNTAKDLSSTFETQFNALEYGLKEGLINYDEYYSGLHKIYTQYTSGVEEIENRFIEQLKNSGQKEEDITLLYATRIAEIRQNYAIKPLEFQKAVGERFLQELDRQLSAIENTYFKHSVILERDIINWQGTINTTSGQWSTSLKDRHKTELDILNAQRANEEEYYSKEKGRLVEELNNNMLTVEQRAGLWAQIEQLDADHLVNQANFNAKEKSLNDEWKANLVSTSIEGLNAFASLTSALNAMSQAQVAEYKRQYEEGKISKEKFEELQKNALEEQASLQIATTVMQTAAGIATVWAQASKLGIIAGPIIAAIQTAAYLANMAAQIQSIQTALRAGLAGDTSGGGTPDTSFTLTSPDAYQNTLSDEVQTDLQANAKDNQKVYVLESDITSKQDNVKSAVTTSTF